MKAKMLERALERMEQRPAGLQDEFAQIVLDMDMNSTNSRGAPALDRSRSSMEPDRPAEVYPPASP
jgi:hypothetical protein